MKDIAEDLNVSIVTVSKVLRQNSDISEATSRRVLTRVKELKYQPNWIARSLVTQRTYIIGLVVPSLMHSFFAEIAKAISQIAQPQGYVVVISSSEENAEIEIQEIELLLNRRVDGLIIASAQKPSQTEIFRRIEEYGIPYVLIDRQFPNLQADYVGANDERIGELATLHLIDSGCRRIAHIRGPEIATANFRLKGYRNALAQRGLQAPAVYVVTGESHEARAYEAMQKLLRLNPSPDGVFCFNDPVAVGAMNAILDAELKIPSDVAIIGAGNVHYSGNLRIPLSTIDQHSAKIGTRAAELLLELMASGRHRRPKRVSLSPELIVRDSSRKNRVIPTSSLSHQAILACR